MQLPEEEIIDGIKIKRCFNYYLGTTVLIDKCLDANINIFNSITEKYDIYHCHDTNTWPIGYILSRRDNAKFICETHEYFPDYICKEWHKDKIKYELTKMLINARGDYIKYANETIVVSEPIAQELKEQYKLEKKPIVIYNTRPIEKSMLNEMINKNNDNLRLRYKIDKNAKIILFQGLVEPSRGVDLAIKLMTHINKSILVIAGKCNDEKYMNELMKIVDENKLNDKVIFTGFLPSDELLRISFEADFLVYLGKSVVKNMELTIPNKFFDYIMAGKPMIISDLYSLTKIIKQNNIGIVLDTKNKFSQLGNQVNEFVNNNNNIEIIKQNIRNIQKKYCWEEQEKKLIQMYNNLL
ncbi:glycosyltransferase [Clostridium botulinum]|nr:glycosyltransferase [Clostridium botulinum]MCS4458300.1 glycosyltransferase [Clostridium botulinum]MCS4460677.1 glycosyltransferase [Clostridium botulinum]